MSNLPTKDNQVLDRALSSSVVVAGVRRVAAESAVCRAFTTLTRSCAGIRDRFAARFSDDVPMERFSRADRLGTLAAGSRLMRLLSAIFMAPTAALHEAKIWRVVEAFLRMDLTARFGVAAIVVITAVVAHTALLAVIGVPVHLVGWSVRVGLVMGGLLMRWRPELLATAWKEKGERH